MPEPHNEPKIAPSSAQGRSIRFADDEWQEITDAAEHLSAELHISISPAEYVRMAARKQLSEREQEAA